MKHFFKSSIFVCVSLLILSFTACNDDDNDGGNNLPHPVGVADYGHSDNYEIYGKVTDEQGNPVQSLLINVQTDRVFVGDIMVYTDAEGNYRFTGLPAWSQDIQPGEIIVQTDSDWDTYERVLYWLLHGKQTNNTRNAIEQDMTVREVVPGTIITGTILDTDNSPIPQTYLLGTNLNISSNQQGPAFNLTDLSTDNEYFTYDESTGTYAYKNCLAGGTYMFHLNANGYDWEQAGATINATPGETTTFNIIMTPIGK